MVAIIPITIAVVPQEQKGVATAATVAPAIPAFLYFIKNVDTFCGSIYNFIATAAMTLTMR